MPTKKSKVKTSNQPTPLQQSKLPGILGLIEEDPDYAERLTKTIALLKFQLDCRFSNSVMSSLSLGTRILLFIKASYKQVASLQTDCPVNAYS